jgi:hypothetical protein
MMDKGRAIDDIERFFREGQVLGVDGVDSRRSGFSWAILEARYRFLANTTAVIDKSV